MSDRDLVDRKLHEWMVRVQGKNDEIRSLQDQLLSSISPADWTYAITCMASMLGKTGAVTMTTNNFGPTGVAITGGSVTGDVTGTANVANQGVQPDLADVLAKLRLAIEIAGELSSTQKADQTLAVDDIEVEAKKPEAERNPSRIRLALASIAQAVTVSNGLHSIYHLARPIITAHFGIDLPSL